MRHRTGAGFVLLLAVSVFWVRLGAESPKSPGLTSLLYTATPHYDPLAWLKGGERFPGGAKLRILDGKADGRQDGKASRPFAPDFFATADASVSFDGTHILFAGKRHARDSWQIWEQSNPGGKPVRVTACAEDCVLPFYLPEDRVVYAHRVRGIFQVETMPRVGGAPLQLTYLPGNAVPTDVLRDGRILFQSAYPLGGGASAELYTVYSDGSGVESYRCDHGSNRHSGRQVSSGDIVFANERGAARFTSALAHAADLAIPAGEFAGDVAETPGGDWIFASRPNAKAPYSLQWWNPQSNAGGTVLAENNVDAVEPRVLAPRAVPNRHPSGLHDWAGANVLCLNAYTSKFKITDGAIGSVRLYTLLPEGERKLLGSANVEVDGSFFLHVPSDQPLQLELLDRAGKSLQSEHGWFWLRRGEQRVCVGCHAGPERAPENAVPAILLKSTEPADLTIHEAPGREGGR